MTAKRIWTEIHRPSTLETYVFQNDAQRQQLTKFVTDQEIPHLLLTGTAGSGKTTIAKILINELGLDESDVMYRNASRHTGVDFIREEVLPFAEAYLLGKIKIIWLEEADRLSPAAQDMLRDVMEQNAATCRFIMSCNYEHKITVPLKSRLTHLRFKASSIEDVQVRMAEILITEGVDFELETLERYVAQAYPDLRKIITNLQLNTIGGKLGQPQVDVDGEDYLFKLVDLVVGGNLREIRKLVSEVVAQEQLPEVFDFLYKNLKRHPKFASDVNAYEQAIVILAEGDYKHGMSALPHLNFEATMIKLFNVAGE